jgi:hypothetical protein
MSFKLFIYYCSLGGGWAAFMTWAIVQGIGIRGIDSEMKRAMLTGAILGALIAATVGAFDAILNSVGSQRILRPLVCLGLGFLSGLIGSVVGQSLYAGTGGRMWMLVLGWILVGVLIGASIGVYDLILAMMGKNDFRAPIKKTLNGIYGGFLGGFLGGLPFGFLITNKSIPISNLTIGLVILGLCIGLFIPLAQVVLKEAWIKIEAGFRAGREIMLSKDETTIGKAEACDIGLFGGQGLEKEHACVVLKNGRYLVEDLDTPGGTFVNDQRVTKPTPLRNGDAIRVGNCILRFGERAKR